MYNVMCVCMCVCMCAHGIRLKKVEDGGEKTAEKADPMIEMMQRIRSGNVNLKKVAPSSDKPKDGNVMAEMAKLLVSGGGGGGNV